MSKPIYIIFNPVYPRDDEVDICDDEFCPNCEHHTFTRTCSDCGGDGGHDGYEEDPLWYDGGDIIPCSNCRSLGYFHWCPHCGWDMTLGPRWNMPEHRGMAVMKRMEA